MKKTSFAVIALIIQFWPFSASAASSCDHAPQGDRNALSRCIDELRKEIERNRSEIETLKTNNTLISKQLCMVAIEQHRRNANSEALKLIIEEACVQFKRPTAPDKRL
jgi:hypothetical protein